MDDAQVSFLHVSQNIPTKSDMEVTMNNPVNCQIHISQAVPRSTSLTWMLNGDADKNQVHVSQNAADGNSDLNCTPDCPQPESEYNYDYYGEESSNAVAPPPPPPPPPKPQRKQQNNNNRNNQRNNSGNRGNGRNGGRNKNKNKAGGQGRSENPKSSNSGFQGQKGFTTKDAQGCPGGSLDACNNGCPTNYGSRVTQVC